MLPPMEVVSVLPEVDRKASSAFPNQRGGPAGGTGQGQSAVWANAAAAESPRSRINPRVLFTVASFSAGRIVASGFRMQSVCPDSAGAGVRGNPGGPGFE